MWRFTLLVVFVILAGCSGGVKRLALESPGSPDSEFTATQENTPVPTFSPQSEPEIEAMPPLPNLGSAPELTNEVWLNTDRPLRLADQRGKVVLIDMWTFG